MAVARERGRLCAPPVPAGSRPAFERLHSRNCRETPRAELLSALILRAADPRLLHLVEWPVAALGRIGHRTLFDGKAITRAPLAAVRCRRKSFAITGGRRFSANSDAYPLPAASAVGTASAVGERVELARNVSRSNAVSVAMGQAGPDGD